MCSSKQSAADHEHLDMMEPNFFEHARRYLTEPTLSYWPSIPIQLDISQFSSPELLIENIKLRSDDPFEILELHGFEEANVGQWKFQDIEVYKGYKIVPLCKWYTSDVIRKFFYVYLVKLTVTDLNRRTLLATPWCKGELDP